jgi:hypothetical protein
LSVPSAQVKGGISSGPSSATSSVDTFFSMDVDPPATHIPSAGHDDQIANMDVDDDMSDDLLRRLPGMFRLLDLIGEQSSGGIGKYFYF